jgi:hypothetical protein
MSDRYKTYDDELLHAFRNAPEDLQANWLGALGDGQRRRLMRSGYGALLAYPALGLAVAALVFAVGEKPLAPIQWILMAVVLVGSAAGGVVGLRRRQAAVAAGQVHRVSGPIQLWRPARGAWRLSVGELDFLVPVPLHHLKHGASYHVFFAPDARQIVAMVPEDAGYQR